MIFLFAGCMTRVEFPNLCTGKASVSWGGSDHLRLQNNVARVRVRSISVNISEGLPKNVKPGS